MQKRATGEHIPLGDQINRSKKQAVIQFSNFQRALRLDRTAHHQRPAEWPDTSQAALPSQGKKT